MRQEHLVSRCRNSLTGLNIFVVIRIRVSTAARQLKQHAGTLVHQAALELAGGSDVRMRHGTSLDGSNDDGSGTFNGDDKDANIDAEHSTEEHETFIESGLLGYHSGAMDSSDEVAVEPVEALDLVVNVSQNEQIPVEKIPVTRKRGAKRRKSGTVAQILREGELSAQVHESFVHGGETSGVIRENRNEVNGLDTDEQNVNTMTEEQMDREIKRLTLKKLQSETAAFKAEARFFEDKDRKLEMILGHLSDFGERSCDELNSIKNLLQLLFVRRPNAAETSVNSGAPRASSSDSYTTPQRGKKSIEDQFDYAL